MALSPSTASAIANAAAAASAAVTGATTSRTERMSMSIARSKNRLHAGIDSACFMTRKQFTITASFSNSSYHDCLDDADVFNNDRAIHSSARGVSRDTTESRVHKLASIAIDDDEDEDKVDLRSTMSGVKSPSSSTRLSQSIITLNGMASALAGSVSPSFSTFSSLGDTKILALEDDGSNLSRRGSHKNHNRASTAEEIRRSLNGLQDVAKAFKISLPAERLSRRSSSNIVATADKAVQGQGQGEQAQCTCSGKFQLPGSTFTPVAATGPGHNEILEKVKLQMKADEEEHRQRENGLYSKIIELQIENANLKGDKETLNRIVSLRDKTLLELHVQLQAMEYVCRENDIKVDIDMCPEEAIENWSFKESDEVYQRILLTTQDLLRTGSKCLEETNTFMGRSASSSHAHQHNLYRSRSARSSMTLGKTSLDFSAAAASAPYRIGGTAMVAGLSEGTVQPLAALQDLQQRTEPVLVKETSRPGTLKVDIETLLRSEQEIRNQQFSRSNSSIGRNKSTVNHANLAEIDASVVSVRDGRRAIHRGDDRSTVHHQEKHQPDSGNDSFDSDDEIENSTAEDAEFDDDDEGQESEFEELGEDMIKYVELHSSVGPPRRETRSSSFSKMMTTSTNNSSTPYLGGAGSVIGTPDMSTAVLMKNLWSSNGGGAGGRRSAVTTPLHHPFQQQQQYIQQQQYLQQQQYHRQQQAQALQGSAAAKNRISGGSSFSNASQGSDLLEDYFGNTAMYQATASGHPASVQSLNPPVGLGLRLGGATGEQTVGLGMTGINKSPEQAPMERFLSTPPSRPPPPPPLVLAQGPSSPLPWSHAAHSSFPTSPSYHPHHQPSSHHHSTFMRSPLSNSSASATFFAQGVTIAETNQSHQRPTSAMNHYRNSYGSRCSSRSRSRSSMMSLSSLYQQQHTGPPPPPPMIPMPPLPACPQYSYRDHTKQKLLEFKRPTHGRTNSHGFVIENVGQFLKRRTYGKTLTRDTMHRGLKRRDSV
ncbi:hypothetical protein EDD11_003328 [Mortierella claussenii]|nr:hypothetical protein EDD11_003328 [Mortierella claussenii]